jgi:hypothetical protein
MLYDFVSDRLEKESALIRLPESGDEEFGTYVRADCAV